MMQARQQKAVKGRNISVRDVVSHMSDGIFIRNIFLVSKWMEALNLFGLFCFPWCGIYGYIMMYDAMVYEPLLLYLINSFLQPHF